LKPRYDDLIVAVDIGSSKIVTVISFRSTVIGGYHSGKLEDVYNKASIKIANGELKTVQQVALEVKELYMSDTDFKNDFSTISLNTRRNKKLIKYILFELETQINNAGTVFDFEENPATIEHILPENAKEDWEQYFAKNVMENYVYRLGNYALLEESKNKEIGNKLYAEKVPVYKTSGFKSINEISYPEWNPNNLDKRQMSQAKYAVSIWKLPYY